MKLWNNKGDTIVEVMMAILILGAVIGGAFAVANKSQQGAQANHERYQAQLLANQQAELFRQSYSTYIATGTRTNYAAITNGPFCFTLSATQTTSCTNGIYTIAIQKTPDANAGIANNSIVKLNYTINVSWDGLNGNRQSLDLVYGL
jgi:Tfp pilus assembly protein PilE